MPTLTNVYFKIIAATTADYNAMMAVLNTKTFYPEPTSTPALPASGTAGFDYRQLFKMIGLDRDGMPIVKTREPYTVAQFNVNVVPTADWTGRYYLVTAPTIVALPDNTEYVNGVKTNYTADVFLSYNYPPEINF